jgi:hypothetical protein
MDSKVLLTACSQIRQETASLEVTSQQQFAEVHAVCVKPRFAQNHERNHRFVCVIHGLQ